MIEIKERIKNISLKENNFHIVSDFDKTLTKHSDVSTWEVLSRAGILGGKYKKERDRLYQIYRPIELDYTLEKEEKNKLMEKWWRQHMDLLIQNKVTEDMVKEASSMGFLQFREEAKEFLHKMQEKNIPVLIISAGIGNVIEEFLKYEEVYYSNIHIISNFINFKNGKINEFSGNIIHSMNKNTVILEESIKNKLENRENIVLFGDGVGDVHMVPEEKQEITIKVGFLDCNIEQNYEIFKKNFDIVLTNNATFYDVEKILEI